MPTSPDPAEHPLVTAIEPLLTRIGATVVSEQERTPDDVPLSWNGEVVAVVRLPVMAVPTGDTDLTDALARLIGDVEAELGAPLAELSRARKQQAVRLLDERGAFTLRKAAETVAKALGVTRFTVYNYLNRTES